MLVEISRLSFVNIHINIMVLISNFTKYNIVTESDNNEMLKEKSDINYWVDVTFISISEIKDAIHSTKKSGLNCRNFHMSNGTVFST